jgi:DNA-binding transcriptional LysR family regulator
MWSFVQGSRTESIAVKGWLTASNAQRDVALDLALQGHGVVRVLDWASRAELLSGALVPVLQDWESPDAPPVNLLYAAQMRRVPRARAFIQFVTELFRQIDAAREHQLLPSRQPLYLRRHYEKASDARRHVEG